MIAVREAGEAESRSAPTLGAMAQLRQMAQVVAMPFVGLMVFAFMMGARKFILFDVVNMELLGCALGAVVATQCYAHWGWNAVCLAGAGISAAALFFWLGLQKRSPVR